jgi:hypothetical protein
MVGAMLSRRFLIKPACFAGLACLMVFESPAGAGAQISSDHPVPFVMVVEGKVSRVRVPERLVVRDDATWLTLWRRHAGPDSGPPPLVNFDRDMVIALFAGQASDSTVVAVTKIAATLDGLEVRYTLRETRPLLAGVADDSPAPFQIVRLARSSLPVRFVQLKTPPVLRVP